MSAKLPEALEFANYRLTLQNQHDALKAKTQSLLNYSLNGGTFTITESLIAYLNIRCGPNRSSETIVLLDNYGNPIEVEAVAFYEEIYSRYIEAINDYHVEYEKLRKARSVSKIVDIHDD